MAFGIKALADDRGSQMNAGYLRVAVALWIVALVAVGYAESYPNRPTAGEMNNIVDKGTECVLGVNERCHATQYQTNPCAYYVAPFTNASGFYLDQSLMDAIASKISGLVPYYVYTNTVYDGTPNIAMLTEAELLERLGIGGLTSQFRIYILDLQERYEVLNALTATRAFRTRAYNGSDANQSTWHRWIADPYGRKYSNTVTGVISPYAYYSPLVAEQLGLENCYYYSTSSLWVVSSLPEDSYRMSYSEYQTCHNWWYFHHLRLEPIQPPWTPYPNGYFVATNGTYAGAGSWFAVTKSPYEGTWYYPPEPDPGTVDLWGWDENCRVAYSTWELHAQYTNQQVANTYEIYLKPTLPEMPTEEAIEELWWKPESWAYTVYSGFEELNGMPTNVYSKIDTAFVQENNHVLTIEFGSDQFEALQSASTHPVYPDEPTEASAPRNFWNNGGSIGTVKGSYLEPENYFFIKTWQFNYCIEQYW
ncbi:MAG: hypothetical protein PHW60_01760 [Kiritimatiellae bacterium]|nr:hypothetical protein [Kiritimatiellia bacterium]